MPRVQASIALPYLLKLKSGLYADGPVRLRTAWRSHVPSFDFLMFQPRTVVSITIDQPDTGEPDEQRHLNARQAINC